MPEKGGEDEGRGIDEATVTNERLPSDTLVTLAKLELTICQRADSTFARADPDESALRVCFPSLTICLLAFLALPHSLLPPSTIATSPKYKILPDLLLLPDSLELDMQPNPTAHKVVVSETQGHSGGVGLFWTTQKVFTDASKSRQEEVLSVTTDGNEDTDSGEPVHEPGNLKMLIPVQRCESTQDVQASPTYLIDHCPHTPLATLSEHRMLTKVSSHITKQGSCLEVPHSERLSRTAPQASHELLNKPEAFRTATMARIRLDDIRGACMVAYKQNAGVGTKTYRKEPAMLAPKSTDN